MVRLYRTRTIGVPTIQQEIEDDGSIPKYSDCDRMILEESGYDIESDNAKKIIDDVVAKNDDEKIFTVRYDDDDVGGEFNRSLILNDAVDEVLKNETFDEFWRKKIKDKLDTELDKKILEQWIDDTDNGKSFIADRVYKKMNELDKYEMFYYIELFREILNESDNEEALKLIDFDDEDFDKMPNIVRLY